MDNLTIGAKNSPNFGTIYSTGNLMKNPAKKAIADTIIKKLESINPKDKQGKSYIKRAEEYGYDVFINDGKNNSVRVDLVSAVTQRNGKQIVIPAVSQKTLIGNYNTPEQFDIKHFDKRYKSVEKDTKTSNLMAMGYIGSFLAAIAFAVGSSIGISTDKTPKPDVSPKTTIVMKDTVKTDSVKPILQDTFKLGRKIIK